MLKRRKEKSCWFISLEGSDRRDCCATQAGGLWHLGFRRHTYGGQGKRGEKGREQVIGNREGGKCKAFSSYKKASLDAPPRRDTKTFLIL